MRVGWLRLPLVLGLLAGMAPVARGSTQPPPVAILVEVSGPVMWRAVSEQTLRQAAGGEQLQVGAVVRTGLRGQARLKWRNGGEFRLMPLSELVVPADEGVLLKQGRVWARFQEKLRQPFYFKAPSATAVVRGTILDVAVNADQSTTVAVYEGLVEVTGSQAGAARLLEPGQSLIVSPFGPLGAPQPLAPGLPTYQLNQLEPPARQPNDASGKDGTAPSPRAGAWDWLRQQRAAVRLERVRESERGYPDHQRPQAPPLPLPNGGPPRRPPGLPPREAEMLAPRGDPPPPPGSDRHGPGPRHFPGDPSGRQPVAADPNYAFPAGRPPHRSSGFPPCPLPDRPELDCRPVPMPPHDEHRPPPPPPGGTP
ncbi:MAG: FecR family protein [Candidatus Sericytochromatia bacterium]|nr:FecR family protein [Candidatus Sericytochromatia bacterium]